MVNGEWSVMSKQPHTEDYSPFTTHHSSLTMNNQAKIRLSSLEMELVANSDWILTKNGIIQKVKYLLEDLQEKEQDILSSYDELPAEVVSIPPKISKGENYKGLPWLVLDYPRYFEKDNHFAIRSMFWWGNFFSVTLHLTGVYKKTYEPRIIRSFGQLREDGYYICTGQDEWEHHFEAGNYSALKEMDPATFNLHVKDKSFLKLATHYPLQQWDNVSDLLLHSFSEILNMLTKK